MPELNLYTIHVYITNFAVRTREGSKFAVVTNGGNTTTSMYCQRQDFAVSTRPLKVDTRDPETRNREPGTGNRYGNQIYSYQAITFS